MVSAFVAGLGIVWMAAIAVAVWGVVDLRGRHAYLAGFLLMLVGQPLSGSALGVGVAVVGVLVAVAGVVPMLTGTAGA